MAHQLATNTQRPLCKPFATKHEPTATSRNTTIFTESAVMRTSGLRNLIASVFVCSFLLACGSATTIVAEETLKVATWNVREVNGAAGAAERKNDFREFYNTVKPDVLLVQEVTGLKCVEAIRDAMGWTGAHCACSDFTQPDDESHSSFEVGIISRLPLENVLEYDVTLDANRQRKGAPEEVRLISPVRWQPRRPEGIRGFLFAEVQGANLGVAVVHLKSSRGDAGKPDEINAQLREFVAAGVADSFSKRIKQKPMFSFLVGGDFNVGATDKAKNGSNLDEDTFAPTSKDLYDDTFSIFTAGIPRVGGLKMNVLTTEIGETYVSDKFVGTGAIDNLVVISGPEATGHSFAKATKSENSFGSDHRPVWTEFTIPALAASTTPPAKEAETKSSAPASGRKQRPKSGK